MPADHVLKQNCCGQPHTNEPGRLSSNKWALEVGHSHDFIVP